MKNIFNHFIKLKLKITLAIIAFVFIQSVSAQAPQKMSYQAVIRNANNELLLNANVAIKISILENSSTGNAVYVESHKTITNANGLASIKIGDGIIQSGSFDSIDWGNNSYFIKTQTDLTGGSNYSITGVSELMSVPYALYAKNGGNGLKGDTGLTGAKGDTGPQGIQGIKGDSGVTSGEYNPLISPIVNVNWAGGSITPAYYFIINNLVFVTIPINVNPTSSGFAHSKIKFSLPVKASNPNQSYIGLGSLSGGGEGFFDGGRVDLLDDSNGVFYFGSHSSTTKSGVITLMYKI
jgi:hypothetical protein